MSETEMNDPILNMTEEQLQRKFTQKKDNTSMLLQEEAKKKAEKETMRKIFEKNAIDPRKVLPKTALNEANFEPVRVDPHKAKLPDLSSRNVNKEHEPVGLSWSPSTEADIMVQCPTFTYAKQMMDGAKQQEGFAVGLPGQQGTLLFVKYENGQLYSALPNHDPKSWANQGLNPDLDNDEDDVNLHKKSFPTTTNLPPRTGTPTPTLESKEENSDFLSEDILDEGWYGKVNAEDLTNPRQKALVTKLLDMADQIRKGKPELKDEKEELPLPAKKALMMEEKQDKVVEAVDLANLSQLAMKISTARKRNDSEQLEELEDNLLNYIAESLLLSRKTVNTDLFESYTNEFKTCLEG